MFLRRCCLIVLISIIVIYYSNLEIFRKVRQPLGDYKVFVNTLNHSFGNVWKVNVMFYAQQRHHVKSYFSYFSLRVSHIFHKHCKRFFFFSKAFCNWCESHIKMPSIIKIRSNKCNFDSKKTIQTGNAFSITKVEDNI